MNPKYMSDKDFLLTIDNDRLKEQTVRIVILDWREREIKSIEGVATGGSLNLTGDSSVRRTANLNMIALYDYNDLTNIEYQISLNKKIRLEIGFKNKYNKYTEFDTIWFPLGTFVITSASITHDLNNVTISVQLKDKMCLLNGECGGTIPAATQFDEEETYDEEGNIYINKPTIPKIIREAVHHFGGEQTGKIVITDIDERSRQVLRWTGNYSLWKKVEDDYINFSTTEEEEYTEIKYGENIGYRMTDTVYPSELVIDAGGTVCDVLDKIKEVLGNYEYFYDVYGYFIFREKKNYLNTSFSTTVENKLLQDGDIDASDYITNFVDTQSVYNFNNTSLVTSYSNTPQYAQIKNDFIVWGKKETAAGVSRPIRYHLAIDNKPETGNIYSVFKYLDDSGIYQYKGIVPIEDMNIEGKPGVAYEKDEEPYFWNGNTSKKYYIQEKAINDDIRLDLTYKNTPLITFDNENLLKKITSELTYYYVSDFKYNYKNKEIRYSVLLDVHENENKTYYEKPEQYNKLKFLNNDYTFKKLNISYKSEGYMEHTFNNTEEFKHSIKRKDGIEKTFLTNSTNIKIWDSGVYASVYEDNESDTWSWKNLNGYSKNYNYFPYDVKLFKNYTDGKENIIYYMNKEVSEDNPLIYTKCYMWKTIPSNTYYRYLIDSNNDLNLDKIQTNDWRSEYYLDGTVDEANDFEVNYYYAELANEWPRMYELAYEGNNPSTGEYIYNISSENQKSMYSDKGYITNINDLEYFLDFIDTNGPLNELSVNNIGRRTKIINDDSINCIFETVIPDYAIVEAGANTSREDDLMYDKYQLKKIQVDSDIYSQLSVGGLQNSAYDAVRDLLYQYTRYNASISISAIPIFYLEPNTRITVNDNETGINGDYIINSMSIPFDINGTMNVSCTKVMERI